MATSKRAAKRERLAVKQLTAKLLGECPGRELSTGPCEPRYRPFRGFGAICKYCDREIKK